MANPWAHWDQHWQPSTPAGYVPAVPVSPAAGAYAYWAQPAWVQYAQPAQAAGGYFPAPPGFAAEPRRYPELAPILAGDLKPPAFDVRTKPRDSIPSDIFRAHRYMYAVARAQPPRHMRLISPEFPWSVDIKVQGGGQVITVEAVWEALYKALQEPLADSEWGMIVLDENNLERMEFAARKRRDKEGSNAPRYKRVDWLGDGVLFKGLVRDEGFERRRLLPGSEKCAETWVVKFGVV